MADAKVASSKVVGKARILQTQQHEACLRLIEAIKKRPIVYNSKSTEYRESVGKKIAWAEVQAELSLPTVESAQKLWKTLRDRYIRELRLVETHEKEHPDAEPYVTHWPYYDLLEFYKNCGRAPRTYTRSNRKARHSVASVSSGEESRDNTANLGEHSRASSSSSPVLSNASSSSNLTFTPRGSSSNLVPEVPSDVKHEPAESAFHDPSTSTPNKDLPRVLLARGPGLPSRSPELPQEHKAFLDVVMTTASRRDSEASRSASSNPGRTPLKEFTPNAPFRHGPGSNEPSWPVLNFVIPGNVQSNDAENHLVPITPVARVGRARESAGADVAECKNEVLDLSRDSSALGPTRDVILAVKPSEASSVHMTTTHPSPRESAGSSTTDVSQLWSPSGLENGPSTSGDSSGAMVAVPAQRKRKSVIEECAPTRLRMDDEDALFAMSLVPSLKRLSYSQKSVLKAKIMQSFADAECGMMIRNE